MKDQLPNRKRQRPGRPAQPPAEQQGPRRPLKASPSPPPPPLAAAGSAPPRAASPCPSGAPTGSRRPSRRGARRRRARPRGRARRGARPVGVMAAMRVGPLTLAREIQPGSRSGSAGAAGGSSRRTRGSVTPPRRTSAELTLPPLEPVGVSSSRQAASDAAVLAGLQVERERRGRSSGDGAGGAGGRAALVEGHDLDPARGDGLALVLGSRRRRRTSSCSSWGRPRRERGSRASSRRARGEAGAPASALLAETGRAGDTTRMVATSNEASITRGARRRAGAGEIVPDHHGARPGGGDVDGERLVATL